MAICWISSTQDLQVLSQGKSVASEKRLDRRILVEARDSLSAKEAETLLQVFGHPIHLCSTRKKTSWFICTRFQVTYYYRYRNLIRQLESLPGIISVRQTEADPRHE